MQYYLRARVPEVRMRICAILYPVPAPGACFGNSGTGLERIFVKVELKTWSPYNTLYAIMAKWGEGDPRWIVEERPDATNVNNWHW